MKIKLTLCLPIFLCNTVFAASCPEVRDITVENGYFTAQSPTGKWISTDASHGTSITRFDGAYVNGSSLPSNEYKVSQDAMVCYYQLNNQSTTMLMNRSTTTFTLDTANWTKRLSPTSGLYRYNCHSQYPVQCAYN